MPNDKEKLEEKKEEKQPTTLESAINETSQAGSGLVNSTIGITAIGASTALFGLDGLVTALSFPLGGMIEKRLMVEKDASERQFKSKHFRDEAIGGALFTIPLWGGVNILRELPKAFGLEGTVNALAVGGLSFASIPLFNAIYYPIKYVVDNKKFSGLVKDFKEHYWEGTKKSLYLSIPWAGAVATSVAMPALYPYLFPILAAFEVAYRVVLSKEKLNYAKLFYPFTYIPKFANPFYIASGAASATGKVYRQITSAVYDLGVVIRNVFSKAPAPIPAPATVPT